MSPEERRSAEERFLVLAPSGRDAPLTCILLGRGGVSAVACAGVDELCRRVAQEGAAGVILAEEALTPRADARLRGLLAEQPTWSDLPVLLFTAGLAESRQPRLRRLIEGLGNVTVLDHAPPTPRCARASASTWRGRSC